MIRQNMERGSGGGSKPRNFIYPYLNIAGLSASEERKAELRFQFEDDSSEYGKGAV